MLRWTDRYPGGVMNLLIVDDELVNRRLLVGHLQVYGHCDTARDGESALALVQDCLEEGQIYDLIVLDIRMPRLDGFEMLARLRRREQRFGRGPSHGSRVIVCSVLDDPQSILTAYSALCDGYLTKPIDLRKLDELLSELFPGLRKPESGVRTARIS